MNPLDPHGPTAKRFPLVARVRPACLPLPERVAQLVELADTSRRNTDQGLASTVYNQSALLASDLGLPDLARTLCHQHAAAYLHACPLPAMSAIRALEPLVNLARLHIRADRNDDGHHHLLTLHAAVDTATGTVLDGVAVPSNLAESPQQRQEVRAWLWRVLLADGTRALTTTGRWQQALTHIEQHHGIGTRMLDGRQVAVIAALTARDTATAAELLDHTAPGEPWEQAVTACLTALCQRSTGQPVDGHIDHLLDAFPQRLPELGLTVFDTRLGLTVLDVIAAAEHPAARTIADILAHRALDARDGYAAREILSHALTTALITDRQAEQCHDLVNACALGTRTLPAPLRDDLAAALHTSDEVIRTSLGHAASER